MKINPKPKVNLKTPNPITAAVAVSEKLTEQHLASHGSHGKKDRKQAKKRYLEQWHPQAQHCKKKVLQMVHMQ